MWTKLLTAAGLAVALGAVPAIAQQDPIEQPQPPAATEPAEPSTGELGSEMENQPVDVTGWPVHSSDGQKLGDVTQAKIGSDGSIESIYFDMGGVLGLGAKSVEVSQDKFSKGDNQIDLSLTAEEAEKLPEASSAAEEPADAPKEY